MTFDPMTANPCPDFCSEMCEVGLGEYDTQHRSQGTLAVRGGPMVDRASGVEAIDVVPSVGVLQKPGANPAQVFLRIDAWMGSSAETWTIPRDLDSLSTERVFTPDRAEHLGELLIEAARIARATPLSPQRVTETGPIPVLGGAA